MSRGRPGARLRSRPRRPHGPAPPPLGPGPARAACLAGAVLAASLCVFAVPAARAEPPPCALAGGPARLEARRLLDKASAAEDPAVAAADLEAAYRLSPAPLLLYNLGLVRLSQGRGVAALDLLRRYKQARDAAHGGLTAEQQDTLTRAQAARPADAYDLEVRSTPGALLYVDDALVGSAPLGTPLVLARGPHRIRAESGYRQAEASVTPAAGPVALPLPLLAVTVTDGLPPPLTARLAEVLAARGLTAVPARDRDTLLAQLRGDPAPSACGTAPDAACAARLGALFDADLALSVRGELAAPIAPDLGTWRFTLALTDLRGVRGQPEAAAPQQRGTASCPECGHELAAASLREALFRMLDALPPDRPPDPAARVCALARGTARLEARRLLDRASQGTVAAVAIADLEVAYRLSPAPVLLYNLGLVYERAGLRLTAADLFRRYEALAGTELSPERRHTLLSTLAALREPAGSLRVRGEDGAALRVDGRFAGTLPLPATAPLLLGPGPHRVRSEHGHRSTERTVTIEPGVAAEVALPLPPAVVLLADPARPQDGRDERTLAARSAEAAGLVVIPERDRELLLGGATEYDGCEDSLPCQRRLAQFLGARFVLGWRRAPGPSPGAAAGTAPADFRVRVHDVERDQLATARGPALAAAISALCSGLGEHTGGHVRIVTAPPATLHIDGWPLGDPAPASAPAPGSQGVFEQRLLAGRYGLVAARAGHWPVRAALVIRGDDRPFELRLRLQRDGQRPVWRLVLGSVSLGLGAALLSAGAYELGRSPPCARDPGDPGAPGRCGPGAGPGMGMTGTGAPGLGIGLAVPGALLLTLGTIGLALPGPRAPQPAP